MDGGKSWVANHRIVRRLLAGFAFLIAFLPSAAFAHYIEVGWATVWGPSGGNCVEVFMNQDHGQPSHTPESIVPHQGGWWTSGTRFMHPLTIPLIGTYDCGEVEPLAAGRLRQRIVFKADMDYDGDLEYCNETPWFYSTQETGEIRMNAWVEGAYHDDHDLGLCGTYPNTSARGVGYYKNGSTWYGGYNNLEPQYSPLSACWPWPTCTPSH